MRSACEESLCWLLYYQHRVDPEYTNCSLVPWPSSSTRGRCATLACPKPHPTRSDARKTCIQSPPSRRCIHSWSRDPEGELLDTVRELGIGFVAYSPLGRGFWIAKIAN